MNTWNALLLTGTLLCSCFASCAPSSKTTAGQVSEEDAKILCQIVKRSVANHWQPTHYADSLMHCFLGRPYVSHTLESRDGVERLTVNLRELDCVTYVENVLATKQVLESYPPQLFPMDSLLNAFPKVLQEIRYRNGELTDYSSRLHYTSEWLFENEKAGRLRNLTSLLGGKPFPMDVRFMSEHPHLYAPLRESEEVLEKMQVIESHLNKLQMTYIPKEELHVCIDDIPNGSLVVFTSAVEGLDTAHLGFAYQIGNTLHLMHASSTAGKVLISGKSLYDYLMDIKHFTGMMVYELL